MSVQVLSAGRSRQDLEALEVLLRKQPDIAVTTRLIANGHADPLQGIAMMPDVLILDLSERWEEELNALAERPPVARPPVIVVGPSNDLQTLRKAMQAGARDFFTRPVHEAELAEALRQVARERAAHAATARPRLTAVINAKGGSGATMLACNMAHVVAAEGHKRVALLDLDLQFGTLPLYFDLKCEHDLGETLEAVERLDAAALEGYLNRHPSGVRVLGANNDHLVLPGELSDQRLGRLLDLLVEGSDWVVVDLPRQVDAMAGQVLERADRVVIVMQQSLTHVRDARRLIGIFEDGFSIPRERLTVVVNRYDRKGRIGLADIGQALGRVALETVPNDFGHVAESVNLGVPLHEHARSAPSTRAIKALATKLSGSGLNGRNARPGLFGRALSGFMGL